MKCVLLLLWVTYSSAIKCLQATRKIAFVHWCQIVLPSSIWSLLPCIEPGAQSEVSCSFTACSEVPRQKQASSDSILECKSWGCCWKKMISLAWSLLLGILIISAASASPIFLCLEARPLCCAGSVRRQRHSGNALVYCASPPERPGDQNPSTRRRTKAAQQTNCIHSLHTCLNKIRPRHRFRVCRKQQWNYLQ